MPGSPFAAELARVAAAAAVLLLPVLAVRAQNAAPTPPAALDVPPSMTAVRYHEFGPPERLTLEQVPTPSPTDDQMLVRVHAAAVNPVDAKLRAGMFKSFVQLPATPGYDVSGTVVQVGKHVSRFKPGDEIYAYLALSRGGGYAQFAVVGESEAAMRPASLSHQQAAAVPLAALTAWQALIDTAKLDKGQTVLIHGGSGGVGSFAVQIAKARGATVLATASARNQEFLKQLGADTAIDYAAQKFEDFAKDVDVVLDTVGGETQARSFGVLKKGGVLVSIVGGPDQARARELAVRAAGILVQPNGAQLAEIGALIDSGKIKPEVSMTLPLSEARKAHEQIETTHTRGKIVLNVFAPEKK